MKKLVMLIATVLSVNAVTTLDVTFVERPTGYDLSAKLINPEPEHFDGDHIWFQFDGIGSQSPNAFYPDPEFKSDYTWTPGYLIPDLFSLGTHTVSFNYGTLGQVPLFSVSGSYTVTQLPTEMVIPKGVPDGGSTSALLLSGIGLLGIVRHRIS